MQCRGLNKLLYISPKRGSKSEYNPKKKKRKMTVQKRGSNQPEKRLLVSKKEARGRLNTRGRMLQESSKRGAPDLTTSRGWKRCVTG